MRRAVPPRLVAAMATVKHGDFIFEPGNDR